jgi:hypothetical protein
VAPLPALRPVVSSPLPSEPDLRISPHPALHEHIERSPAHAASVVSEVPAPRNRQQRAGIHQRPPSRRIVLRAHWTPSPCRRLSRPPWWRVTATTPTGPPPHPDGNSGRCACTQTPDCGSAGTAGTLPTFTHQPVGRVGAQLYRGGIVARYRNPARDLDRPNSHQTGEMALNSNQDQAPQQPTAASCRADSAYRGFKYWFVSYAFLPCYRTRPAGGGPLLDRQGPLPPSVPPRTSDCPSASPDRYGGRGWVLSSHPVNGASWRRTASGQRQPRELSAPSYVPRINGEG